MIDLSEISIDKIETDIMSVLYANINRKFTQYELFNKLLVDKYDVEQDQIIYTHPNFKSKFLLVIRTLMSKYDDVKLTKKDSVYTIMLNVVDDENNNNVDDDKDMEFIDKLNLEKQLYVDHKNGVSPLPLSKLDYSNMYDYIYDNGLDDYINWKDPVDSNTIFHELVLFNNVKQTQKLINENEFDFEIKNSLNQTPVDLINSSEMSNVIINGLIAKTHMLKAKYEQERSNVKKMYNIYRDKVAYYNSDEHVDKIISNTSFCELVEKKTEKYHLGMYLISFLILYFAIKYIYYICTFIYA